MKLTGGGRRLQAVAGRRLQAGGGRWWKVVVGRRLQAVVTK